MMMSDYEPTDSETDFEIGNMCTSSTRQQQERRHSLICETLQIFGLSS